jgi:hypothetical protein
MAHLTVTQGGTSRRKVRLLVTSLAFVTICAAVLALSSPALAQTPTFTEVNVYGGDQLDLNVSFTEVGLEPGESVDYTLTASATLKIACLSPSGRTTGKSAVLANQPQSVSATFLADASGTVTAPQIVDYLEDLTGPPPSCPGHLQNGSECAIYRQIVLTDMTNNVSYPIAGTIASPDHLGGRC